MLRAEGLPDAHARALLVAAEASFVAGDTRSAQALVEEAGPLVARGEDRVLKLERVVVQARVLAVSRGQGGVGTALGALTRAAAQAKTAGFVQVELQARLAAGRIEADAGQAGPARVHLEAVAREARAKGLGLIARQATP